MTQLVTISANMAAVAAEALRTPQRVPNAIAAREARRVADKQLRPDADEGEDATNMIQSTEVALDLMTKGNRQPQAGLKQALRSYEDF